MLVVTGSVETKLPEAEDCALLAVDCDVAVDSAESDDWVCSVD